MAPEITIRQATSADAFSLRRLAALDDRPALRGSVLLAEQGGEVRAALSLENGRAIIGIQVEQSAEIDAA